MDIDELIFEKIGIASESGIIEEIGYDISQKALLIQYKGKNKYVYKDVPVDTFNQMTFSKSVGSYVSKNVKGKYEYIKLVDTKGNNDVPYVWNI